MSVGLASPQSAGWAAGWETREELVLQLESEGCLLADSHLQEGQTFGLLRPSTDQMRPTHIMEVICFSQSQLTTNVNPIHKYLTAISRLVLDQTDVHHSLTS